MELVVVQSGVAVLNIGDQVLQCRRGLQDCYMFKGACKI